MPAYKRAIAADPGNLNICNDLGNTYFALKQYSDAAQAFAAATQHDPSYALGSYNQAHALRKAERSRDAAEPIGSTSSSSPTIADPYYGPGQTLKALGDSSARSAHSRNTSAWSGNQTKWVEKARAELQALEAAQPVPKPVSSSGKIEEILRVSGRSGADNGGRHQQAHEHRPGHCANPPVAMTSKRVSRIRTPAE